MLLISHEEKVEYESYSNELELRAVASWCARSPVQAKILTFSITERTDNYPVAIAPGFDPWSILSF